VTGRDPVVRAAFRDHVATERRVFADQLSGERAETFARIKVEGIVEAGLGVVVSYDPTTAGPQVLGGTRSPTRGCTRCAWRSRTCGWPRLPRGSGSGG